MKKKVVIGGSVLLIILLLITAGIPLYSAQPLYTNPSNPLGSSLIPTPSDGATDVSTTTDLSWINTDQNTEQIILYDIYFGTTTPPPQVATMYGKTIYDPGILKYNTDYYWSVQIYDNAHDTIPKTIWKFTTESPMLEVQPPQQPTQVNPLHDNPGDRNKGVGRFNWNQHGGALQTFNTTSINLGQIYYQFNWGDGTTSAWFGPYTSGKIVTATHDFDTIGFFNVTVIARVNSQQSLPSPALSVRMYLLGDINADGAVTTADIDPFVAMMSETKQMYYQSFPYGYWYTGDINQDGSINGADIDPFVALLTNPHNNPPLQPSNPTPSDGAKDTNINITLRWLCGEPDGDLLTYDILFGTTNPPTILVTGYPITSYQIKNLHYQTQYYWRIIARDDRNASMPGPTWTFTTQPVPNHPPYVPNTPNPKDGATDVQIITKLSWIGGDPDITDFVTYDVYFGTHNPPPKVVSNQSATQYDPGTLAYNTTYYWKIIAWDSFHATTPGPLWSFHTTKEPNQPPYTPTITGPSAGVVNIPYTFAVNTTDPNDDPLYYNISWDDGNFSGWIGPFNSGEIVQVTYQWASPAVYELTVKAKDGVGESGWSNPWSINISQTRAIQINNIKIGYIYIRLFNDKSYGYIHLLDLLNMSVVIGFSFVVNTTITPEVKTVEFNLTRLFTGEVTTVVDTDFSDGAIATFNATTGFFSIAVHAYNLNGIEIGNQTLDSVIFFNPSSGGGTVHHIGTLFQQHTLAHQLHLRPLFQRHT